MQKSADAFRTISEVAEELNLPQHVLRFWETRFTQIKPMKRAGGRRYYRPDDFVLLQGIRYLLYDQGYTIKGVQKQLKEHGNKFVMAIGAGDLDALSKMQTGDANAAKATTATHPMTQSTQMPEVDMSVDVDQDAVIGKSKVSLSRRFFSKNTDTQNSDTIAVGQGGSLNKSLTEEDRALLQEALYDLLECKRLLDQTR